ncbi:hypothetical protein [Petrotoga olearia]|uniref:Uncharacterized protein n=2 Tax=Petrotoga olearia TaxID=156203 RepID=A0A2K1P094_9BACT|nr:hypothetical protein [Petrotoga olearia]PNR96157.1 hypothetical protein X929_05760 [Petrotoga olearia DSM 13574]RMA71426.1 hypothetical protein C8D75_1522 [Petrotoga olearia]
MLKQILFFAIISLSIFFFVSGIYLTNSKTNDTVDFLSSTYVSQEEPLIRYLSDTQELRSTNSQSFFKKIDEKGTYLTKISQISNNEYVSIAVKGNQYFLYFLDEEGSIRKEIFIESGQVRINDFVFFNNTFTFVGQKNGKPYILNISKTGETNWSLVINYQGALSTIKNTSGSYVVGGWVIENTNSQAYISEVNLSGKKIWENTYGRDREERIVDLVIDNNRIITVGTSNSNPQKQNDLLILVYSREGILLFSDEYGYTTFHENPNSIVQDNEGNIYIGGYITTLNELEWKGFIMKISKDLEQKDTLEVEYFETLAIKSLSRVEELKVYNNQIYLMGVCVDNWPNYDLFLRIINPNGVLIEQKIYGTNEQELIYSFEILPAGEILGTGQVKDSNNEIYPLIIKTDSSYSIRQKEKP